LTTQTISLFGCRTLGSLFVVVRKVTPDKVIEALKPYGGTVLKTSLTHEDETRLQEALRGKVAAGVSS